MPRLLFEKTGNAVWISHLDLMRVFQRSFKRAGLPLTHTQGFNPRPSVSIALPLSVGVQSHCELLDFDLDGEAVPCQQIMERLNCCLVEGVRVLAVYDVGRKLRDLSLLQCRIALQYEHTVCAEDVAQISSLFDTDALVVPKKTKNGMQDQNIIPMIRNLCVSLAEDRCVMMDAVICCQNPTLNPAQLVAAISINLPQLQPVSSRISRVEIFDNNEDVFR